MSGTMSHTLSRLVQMAEEAQDEMIVKDHRIAELEAKLADATARPEIRRQSAMQMVIAISLITRACPEASFQEIHDMWAAHADEDAAEQAQKDAANAGGPGSAALASWFGSWMAAGAPQDKCLCACLEPGCPTFEKVYKKGRGFVSRYELEREQEDEEHEEWDCSCATPEMCRRDCEEGEIARELYRATGVPATMAEIARVKRERHPEEYAPAPVRAPAPAPLPPQPPRAPRSWAQIAAARPKKA